jgi:ABC-type Fe3+-hydroxamate transport system substrate-binding protein
MTVTDDATYRYKPQSLADVIGRVPRRIVSLVPSMTETLFHIGVGDKLVGITDDCLFPEDKLDSKLRVGAMDAVRVEDITGLRPDLVIVNREENTQSDIDALDEAGLTVWQTFPRTVMEAMNLIWDALHTFMVEDRMMYERVNLINRTIDWVGAASEAKRAREEVCKVFVPLLSRPLTTFGADTYAHDLMKTAGGTNVFADKRPTPTSDDPADDLSRYPQVTLAEVEAAQPDVVLLPGYPLAFAEDDIETYRKLDIPAAKTDRIYLIDGSLVTYHGTRLARALNELSELLCPTEETDE